MRGAIMSSNRQKRVRRRLPDFRAHPSKENPNVEALRLGAFVYGEAGKTGIALQSRGSKEKK